MKYLFEAELDKTEEGYSFEVPFNVWEVVQQREVIPAEVTIEGKLTDCELIPKEKGMYEVNFKSDAELEAHKVYEILLRVHRSLTIMNENSPYSLENPVRKIDSIDLIVQSGDGLCGQTCIAMLAGVSTQEVIDVMNCREWQGTMGKLISALNYYGLAHSEVIVYPKNPTEVKLPNCCIIIEKLGRFGHYLIQYDGKFYDPNAGIIEEYDMSKLLGYLEIIV